MTPRFLAWCLVLSASVFKCAVSFSLSFFSPMTNTSVLSWFSWRKSSVTSIHLYQAINRAVVVGCSRNIELGVICIAMIVDVVPHTHTHTHTKKHARRHTHTHTHTHTNTQPRATTHKHTHPQTHTTPPQTNTPTHTRSTVLSNLLSVKTGVCLSVFR